MLDGNSTASVSPSFDAHCMSHVPRIKRTSRQRPPARISVVLADNHHSPCLPPLDYITSLQSKLVVDVRLEFFIGTTKAPSLPSL